MSWRQFMARKIRLGGLVLMVLVLLSGLIAISVISNNNVGDVKSISVEQVKENSASIKWQRVGSADGYYVYQNSGEKEQKIATIKDPKTTEFTAKKLDDSTKYTLSVKAYKNVRDDVAVSKENASISLFTLPKKQVVELSAIVEGEINVNFVQNKRALGYEIQYSTDKKLENAEAITVDDTSTIETSIKKLNVGDTYYVRARSYAEFNEEKVYGEWSDVASQKVLSNNEINKVDPNKPMIAVTFDDGPGYNGASKKILDVIEKYHIKATFFMVGKNAAGNSENVKRKVALGCQIGNHTYNHEHYGKNVTPADISKATAAIEKAGGAKVTCFRSPGGNTTDAIRAECKKEGMPLYYWSLDTLDWKYRDQTKVYNAVMKNVEDGDIILMHEIYQSTADAFEKMVPQLLKKGYQFVTCDELIEAKTGKKPEPGTQYVNASTIRNKTS